jgi:hypothetical protein
MYCGGLEKKSFNKKFVAAAAVNRTIVVAIVTMKTQIKDEATTE